MTDAQTEVTSVEHGGALIEVHLSPPGEASLWINGLVRETGQSESVLRLTSTVQTDYEWHEFVEALVEFNADNTQITITSNKVELIRDEKPGMKS